MILDAQLVLDNAASLAVAAGDYPSSGIIDFMGVGVGSAPPNYFGLQNAVFGEDIGIGDGASPPNVLCVVGTTFLGGTGINFKLQESVDSGAPGYTPASWLTVAETGVLGVALLTSGTKVAEFTVPPRQPGQAFPRFLRLLYTVTGTFTAGTIAFAGIITGRDDSPAYPNAY